MMKQSIGMVMVAALLVPAVRAEFPPCVELPRIVPYAWELTMTPSEEYATMLKDFRAVRSRFDQLFARAKSEARNEEVTAAFERQLQSFGRRMVRLARENSTESFAADALLWVAAHVPSEIRMGEVANVVVLQCHQPEKLLSLYRHLAQADSSEAEQLAKAGVEK